MDSGTTFLSCFEKDLRASSSPHDIHSECQVAMYQHAFIVECNGRSLSDTWTLLNSIHAYHGRELRVFIVSHQPESRHVLQSHPLGNALTVLDVAAFEVPKVDVDLPIVGTHRQPARLNLAEVVATACILDEKSMLVSRFDDVFRLADEGKIVASHDGSIVSAHVIPRLSGGFICFNLAKHRELSALFESAFRFRKERPDDGVRAASIGAINHEIISDIVRAHCKQGDLELLPRDAWQLPAETDTLEVWKEDAARLEILNTHVNSRQRFIHRRALDGWNPLGEKRPSNLGLLLSVCDHFSNMCGLPLTNDSIPKEFRGTSQVGPNPPSAGSPAKLVIGIITCPRPGTHFVDTVWQLRDAGFEEIIHVFCEPGVTTIQLPDVVLHKNLSCRGGVGNWRHCLEWLVANTSAEFFLMCEDDVAYCAGAKAILEAGLRRLSGFGFLSLYTPLTEKSFYEEHGKQGWIELNRGWRAVGTQSMCLTREFATPLLQYPLFAEVDQMGGPTDAVVAKYFLDRQVPCYYHFPSLAEHLGRISVHGHGDHMALDFDPEFVHPNTVS